MTRKISGHDGELVVTDAVELGGRITGGLVIEPGGSAVVRGSAAGRTLTVSDRDDAEHDAGAPGPSSSHHDLDGDLGSVVSDIP